MFCSSCGKPMDAVRLRCPACRHCTGAFWLNLRSLVAIVLLLATNYFCLDYVLPVQANYHAAIGRVLSYPTRIYLTLWRDATAVAPWLVGALVVLLVLLRWKTKRWPDWARSGVVLSSLAWLLLVFTLAGTAATYFGSTEDTLWLFDSARFTQGAYDEHMAVQALRRLNAAEAAYRQKNPKLGYTCKLADLRPPAAPAASGYRLPSNGNLFDGDYYHMYTFSFSGCSGSPSAGYRIDANRVWPVFYGHNFCTDQTGAIRAQQHDAAGDCMKSGAPVLPEE